jgi:hypothetical protein
MKTSYLTIFLTTVALTFGTFADTPTIEFIPNFPLVEDQLNTMLKEHQVDLRAEVKAPRDYYEALKREKSFFLKLVDRVHHFFQPIEGKNTEKVIFYNITPRYCRRCDLSKFPQEKMVLFMWEPPSVLRRMYNPDVLQHFSKVYTWNDDLVDNQKFFKFYYPVLREMLPSLPSFKEKKFCTLVCSNLKSCHPDELYSERKKAIEYFERIGETGFEFYGRKWPAGVYKSYRGSCDDKVETIKHYRFSICYENIKEIKGYVTEKIFDCFAAGSVPVYWGASNVTDTIPAGCFIDRRDFASLDDLYAFLKGMSEKEYNGYIERIRAYLTSEQAQLYSQEHFDNILCEAVRD